ncbi:hypothetical protein [Fusibacter ferrireducens]|uniref:DUF91 domain-containing protein n=1 Tax=Fusibacter ferrireducens TaxID=2785058 RepID=A0ABR9ZNH1_9FIRM|nr:hypothetical protein [Fusibacter ferrireducens]MBF4692020.1 hypothetical protein [Fusibacter ferrireducens]
MKILTIGSFYDHEFSENIAFRSATSFLDYDIALIDFQYILSEYSCITTGNGNYMGHKCLNNDDSVRIMEDIKRRKLEIDELLKMGRTIIVFTPIKQICYIYTGKSEYSGNGKNTRTTRIVTDIDLLSILPIEIDTIEAQGSNLTIKNKDIFNEINKKFSNFLKYNAYFREPIGTPIWFIKNTNKVVGSYLNIEKGHLIFLPQFEDDEENEEIEMNFLKEIILLVDKLKQDNGDYTLPEWSESFLLPKELDISNTIKDSEVELNALLNRITLQKEMLSKIQENKLLFTGTGRSLEIKVNEVLSEIGFSVVEGETGRDDLIIKYDDKIAVVEIKGVSKSAAEKHAAQLEKWVSGYIAEKEVSPKGILIVNAFKDLPLSERIEEFFPKQMIKYSSSRNHCLLSGIQLLGIYYHILDHPSDKEIIISKIFNTSGVFDGFSEWANFVDEKKNRFS